MGTTPSPPGLPSITPQYSGAGWERSLWHQPSVGSIPMGLAHPWGAPHLQGCYESVSPTCARE